MTNELQFLAGITLFFILAVFYIANKPKPEEVTEPKKSSKPTHKPPKNTAPKSDEIIDILDWMLANSIIDTKEYTRLIGKCLPFIG